MTLLGNVCLVLATLLYAIPLPLLVIEAGRARNDGSALWGAVFLFGPLWLLLLVALGAASWRGGLDWVARGRAPQLLLVGVSCLALFLLTVLAYVGRVEHASQLPWAVRSFVGWADLLLPAAALFGAACALNPGLAGRLPATAHRAPLAFAAVVALFAGAGMAVEAVASSQRRAAARAQDEVQFQDERDRRILAEVQGMDPAKDFPELLNFTNRFEKPEIRSVALEKARARPDFTPALVEVLRGGRAETALIYLDACDAPDPRAVAAPVEEAIRRLAAEVPEQIERTHTLHADQFDFDTRLILAVADKLGVFGVDYEPAIRTYRAALDAPHPRKIALNAAGTIDRWLARHGATHR